MENNIHSNFLKNYYLIRRKVLKIFGGAFHIYGENGELLFYSKQKAFKLREDIRIYTDESMTEEILIIRTPNILDIGAIYYVDDPKTGQRVGALKRHAIHSLFMDRWSFLDKNNNEIGEIKEASFFGALLSRTLNIIPQTYYIYSKDITTEEAELRMRFNPFILKYVLRIRDNARIDRRLIITGGILLAAIERRQQ